MSEGPGVEDVAGQAGPAPAGPAAAAGSAAAAGARLRLARQAHGFSQQQLAGMAGISRQAVSAVESGHTDPSLRVALALGQALGLTVEELFGPGNPAPPVIATAVAPAGAGGRRVALAAVGDQFVALPLGGDSAVGTGFAPAGGLIVESGPAGAGAVPAGTERHETERRETGRPGSERNEAERYEEVAVRPIAPPRPTLVIAGCDPALPLLATPLGLLDPPVAFIWWPCSSGEALRLAAAGLVHAAGVHLRDADGGYNTDAAADIPGGAEVVGFTAWREGLALRPELAGVVGGLDAVAAMGLRIVNREPGAEARRVLDRERARLGIEPGELSGYDSRATGHLQVASAVAAGLADAGVASEPAARAYGLGFVPLADERFDLVLPGKHLGSREVQGLLKVLASPWLLAQLAGLPGYDSSACGERLG
ncbi:MAG TPA: substrate-binding domain-containing protein [Trebonia sp.]